MKRRLVRTLVLSYAVLMLGIGLVSAATVTMNGVINEVHQQAGTFTFVTDGYPAMELNASPELLQGFWTGSWVQVEIEGNTAKSVYPIEALDDEEGETE